MAVLFLATDSRARTVRQAIAAFLVLVLALGRIGRGLANADDAHASSIVIGGIVVPICGGASADTQDPADPGTPAQHDCCDQCLLCAAVILPAAPGASTPAPIARVARLDAPAPLLPSLARPRTPRQSQGPPIA